MHTYILIVKTRRNDSGGAQELYLLVLGLGQSFTSVFWSQDALHNYRHTIYICVIYMLCLDYTYQTYCIIVCMICDIQATVCNQQLQHHITHT